MSVRIGIWNVKGMNGCKARTGRMGHLVLGSPRWCGADNGSMET